MVMIRAKNGYGSNPLIDLFQKGSWLLAPTEQSTTVTLKVINALLLTFLRLELLKLTQTAHTKSTLNPIHA